MTAVTETFPAVDPAMAEKEDKDILADVDLVYKVLSTDYNNIASMVQATARMLRMNALVTAAPYPGEGGFNRKAFVYWYGLHANGLSYAVAGQMQTELGRLWAAGTERIANGGGTGGTASSASGMMGVYCGVVPVSGLATMGLVGLSSSGMLATYAGGALPPIGYGQGPSYAYVDMGGRVMVDDSTLAFNLSGVLAVKAGGAPSFGNVYVGGTLMIAGATTCLNPLKASTVYSGSALRLSGSTVTMGGAFTATAATTLQAALTGTTAYFSGAVESDCVHVEGTANWIGGICADTSDGSDSKQIFLCGGGYQTTDQASRGGTVMAYGNEDAINPGNLYVSVGKIAGAYFGVVSNGQLRLKLDHAGDMIRYTVNGINYDPGSDADTSIITVDVTGAPRLWWDESEDQFTLTKGLILNPAAAFKIGAVASISDAGVGVFTGVGAGTTPTGNYIISAKADQNDYTSVRLSNADAGAAARCYYHLNSLVTNGYLTLYGSGYTTVGAKEQNALVLEHTHAAGLNLVASNASGGIKFYTGGSQAAVLRATLDSAGDLTLADGFDIIVNATTGTKIATAAAQKLGFFGAAPVAQQLKANHNNWAAIGDVVNALVNLGLLDQA